MHFILLHFVWFLVYFLLLVYFHDDLVVNQQYDSEIIKEYVIRGNAAVLKCSIPSFVADFVYVESWIDEEGTVYKHSDSYGAFNYIHAHIFKTILLTQVTAVTTCSKMENTEGIYFSTLISLLKFYLWLQTKLFFFYLSYNKLQEYNL